MNNPDTKATTIDIDRNRSGLFINDSGAYFKIPLQNTRLNKYHKVQWGIKKYEKEKLRPKIESIITLIIWNINNGLTNADILE